MKKKKLRKIILGAIPVMLDHLGLNTWRIDVSFGKCHSKSAAECKPTAQYREAHMTFDPKHTPNKAWALHNLRHELLHVVLCNGQSYRLVVHAACQGIGKPTLAVLDEAWHQNVEMDLVAVERALDFMGRTPEWMAKPTKGRK